MTFSKRITKLNDLTDNQQGRYVLYWMQMFKRVGDNDALNFAIQQANERDLPLVVYEGLKFYYPWANDRIHTFILEGVAEKRAEFKRLGIRYVFYLQRNERDPRDTVARLAGDAALLVTDDYPCFIIPEHNQRIVEQLDIPVFAVDANGVIPLSCYTKEEYAAYTIRPKIKKLLPEYLGRSPLPRLQRKDGNFKVDCPETEVSEQNIPELVSQCAIDHSVAPSQHYKGGTMPRASVLPTSSRRFCRDTTRLGASPILMAVHDSAPTCISVSFPFRKLPRLCSRRKLRVQPKRRF